MSRNDSDNSARGDELLTFKEVRAMCKLRSRSTLWKWQNERGLRTITIDGVKRIRRSDLNEFLRRHAS